MCNVFFLLCSFLFVLTCINRNQTYVEIVTLHERRMVVCYVICWLLKNRWVREVHTFIFAWHNCIDFICIIFIWSYAYADVVLPILVETFEQRDKTEISYVARRHHFTHNLTEIYLFESDQVFWLFFFLNSKVVILDYDYDTWVFIKYAIEIHMCFQAFRYYLLKQLMNSVFISKFYIFSFCYLKYVHRWKTNFPVHLSMILHPLKILN